MRASAFGALERAVGDRDRELQHLLDAVGPHQFRIGASRLVAHADVAAANQELLQFFDRRLELVAAAEDADLLGHDALHLQAQLGGVFPAFAVEQDVELRLLALEELTDHARRDIEVVFPSLAEVGDKLADDHPRDDGLGDRVAAQAIEAVHVPARGLAGREQSL